MKSQTDKLLEKNKALIHSEFQKVISHIQREDGDWYLNTVMIEGCDVPFKYKRKQQYKTLKGGRVNITYYCASETVAGMEFELMKVITIKRS